MLQLSMWLLVVGGCESEPAWPTKEFTAAEQWLEQLVASHDVPGAVVIVGDRSGVVWRKAVGLRRSQPPTPMRTDTIFELASLTKPVAGGSALLYAVDSGLVGWNTRIRSLAGLGALPDTTLRQLAEHRSGLPPVISVRDMERRSEVSPERILRRVAKQRLRFTPGTESLYSDLGFLVLGRASEVASGENLEAYLQRHVFAPLGMDDTGFVVPRAKWDRVASVYPEQPLGPPPGHNRIAKSYQNADHFAAHAGLYATADDLARFMTMVVCRGVLEGKRIFRSESVAQLAKLNGDGYSPGWYAWQAPDGSDGIGKTGWLGTFLWFDPRGGRFVVYLTNRTHGVDDADVWKVDFDGLLTTLWRAHR